MEGRFCGIFARRRGALGRHCEWVLALWFYKKYFSDGMRNETYVNSTLIGIVDDILVDLLSLIDSIACGDRVIEADHTPSTTLRCDWPRENE
jgi:hypothetical protein